MNTFLNTYIKYNKAMLNAIIIEDEKPAIEALVKMLGDVPMGVNIVARLHSVKEGVEFITAIRTLILFLVMFSYPMAYLLRFLNKPVFKRR